MKQEKETLIGWIVLCVSCCIMFSLAIILLEASDEVSFVRVLALAAALSLWPGYVIILSMYLIRRRMKPDILLMAGMCCVLGGLLFFGWPLSRSSVESEIFAIALFFAGNAMVVPFAKRNNFLP